MAVRCKITGTQKRLPEKGACPECATPDVKLTGKGFVAAHDVKIPLGDGPQIKITDDGSPVGDPRDAAVRREIDGVKIRTGKQPLPVASMMDAASVHRGPTLVRGRSMPTRVVDPDGPWTEPAASTQAGWTPDPDRPRGGTRTTNDQGATGRERPDREAFDRPRPKRSKSSKRAYRARQTALRKQAERAGKC